MEENLTKIQTCKCPKCEKLYEQEIDWIGNGIPRIRCNKCKRYPEKDSFLKYYKITFKKELPWMHTKK